MSSPLYRFAKLLEVKYLTKHAYQSLSEILQNAASYGDKGGNGIMNFPAYLANDHAKLNFNVIVNDSMFGSKAEVTDLKVTPSDTTPQGAEQKYEVLPKQIKTYLERHLSGFPDIPRGTPIPLEYGQVDPPAGYAGK